MTVNPVTINPADLKPDMVLGFKIVAIIGTNNDWAAYRGLTDWTDEDVALFGDKLSRVQAESMFYSPVAAGLVYRP